MAGWRHGHRSFRGHPGIHTALLALAVSACAPAEPYGAPRFPFMTSYTSQKSGAPVLVTNTNWWRGFEDPVLDHLVSLALADNLTIAAAKERVIAAQAAGTSLPDPFSLSSEVRAQVRNTNGATAQPVQGVLGLNWMLDPYGKRREQLKAAWARTDAADAEADAARLLVLYNLGNAYVDLRYAQRLLDLRRQEIQSRRRTLSLAESLLETQAGTRLDLVRARARLAEVEAQIPSLEARLRAQMNQIAVLTGRAPGRLAVDLTRGRGQPQASLSPDVGIPADLLRNRPDIRVAERLYYASIADLGAAKADLYPRLSLSGAISLSATNGSKLGHEAYFGPVVAFPIIPDGSARAGVEQRRSAVRLAHTTWKATVLDAILEVENALLQYQASRKSRAAAERSLRLYTEAQRMVEDLLKTGNATIDDLIDADRAVTDAANTLAETRRQQGLDFIALNIRLGSGSRVGTVAVK
ncbi:MAG: efflux transporter outer membrane subunit [Paracoccaceae bacterium]